MSRATIIFVFLLSMILGGCNTASKKGLTKDTFTLDDHAVLVGKVYFIDKGLFSDDEEEASIFVQRISLADGQEDIQLNYSTVLDETTSADFQFLTGGMKTHYVKPGTYLVLSDAVYLDDRKYSLGEPAKRSTFETYVAPFNPDFWSNPGQYFRDMRDKDVSTCLGALTVRAGEVIYFGDINVDISKPLSSLFIVEDNLSAARTHLATIHPDLEKSLQFKPFVGPYFAGAKRLQVSPSTNTAEAKKTPSND